MAAVTQAAAMAMVCALCAAVVKKQAPDVALALSLCGVALILSLSMTAFSPVRQIMDTLAEQAGLSVAVLSPVVKTVGISLLTRVTAELCRDAKESGLAAAMEIAGGICALLVCIPLFEAILQLISELL